MQLDWEFLVCLSFRFSAVQRKPTCTIQYASGCVALNNSIGSVLTRTTCSRLWRYCVVHALSVQHRPMSQQRTIETIQRLRQQAAAVPRCWKTMRRKLCRNECRQSIILSASRRREQDIHENSNRHPNWHKNNRKTWLCIFYRSFQP